MGVGLAIVVYVAGAFAGSALACTAIALFLRNMD